ncbi:hypothetical protein Zmor_022505 [Zophobas morio]|uniref:Uncharacterized protein n=1 Tax=Zophobas morio TaxID=2755281 RepID=A0AA38HYU1_9CUCU|nr:hypothetical protein Zmor_022498 [Zophobas morio]KAJ3644802.1 hypothetical protein Zmor_022505 [Zophobas morio]
MHLNTVAVLVLCVIQRCTTCDFRFDYTTTVHGKREVNEYYDVKQITITSHNTFGVTIENEYIPTLCCEVFNLKLDVEYIIFDNCWIEHIEEECFSQKVQHITSRIAIINNKLTSIKSGTFTNLKVLSIDLKNNLIEVIENESFVNLTSLIFLDLSFNNLRTFNPKVFLNVPNLGTLMLQSNRIESLESNALYFFRKDHSRLDMKCNELTYIDKNVLGGMISENFYLELHNNKLSSLPAGIFDHHSFSVIDVGQNPLKNVSKQFCSRNCTVQDFNFNCAGMDMESMGQTVENIGNWVEENHVNLYTDDYCSFNTSAQMVNVGWSTCNGVRGVEGTWFWIYLGILVILF